jgi:peptidoglycan/xylan/chitin deacetylase (PgdA/CDA1 family)
MARILLYHDVIDEHDDSSGFPGAGAARYKLHIRDFSSHLNALAATKVPIATILSFPGDTEAEYQDGNSFLLTFDDGGVSAATSIADSLERLQWWAHFFVTTDYIGSAGFMTAGQIRELDRRGHFIGSHSCSHPTRMSACTLTQLLGEWSRSVATLSDIVGKAVTVASVPGGYYSRKVAETAADAGIKHLFTSEPTVRTHVIKGCHVYGRYTIYRGMPPSAAAKLAMGMPLPLLRQAAAWKLKKVLKTVGGPTYVGLRRLLLQYKYQKQPRP